MLVIFRSEPISRNCKKFRIFNLVKTYIKKLRCTKFNSFLLNIQLDMLLESVRLLCGLNNRWTDLTYNHIFLKLPGIYLIFKSLNRAGRRSYVCYIVFGYWGEGRNVLQFWTLRVHGQWSNSSESGWHCYRHRLRCEYVE